jgi:hypothetical protein
MNELQETCVQSQSPGGIRLDLITMIADDRTLRISQMHTDLITPTRLWCYTHSNLK